MSLQTSDLNLLFGIIALQTNFVNRAQLVAAFDAWIEDKSQDISQILLATGALTREDHDALSRLVARLLEKHGGDAERSLAAMSSAPEIRQDLERFADLNLVASLGHLGQDASNFVSLPTVADSSLSRAGRFRILRPHAKGGLGQVSVAVDLELNREVALKEILVQHSHDATSRERFVLEAEITGGLEHPGIVPVYALGQSDDGRPFYAMRFVKGDSLKQAIEHFHRTDNPNWKDTGARLLALRQLLGRFIDVCNAMEYAHSRGVLHRDLKPGNIMVGKYGETLVVDWGLAKAVGTQEIGGNNASLRPSSVLSSSVQTQPGSAIGTPAYMSPEQAAGKLDSLGPATDVYSLGATLYHLLCGRPPFEKQDLGEILRKVQKGEFVRPRNVHAQIPRGLEAICLKAMSIRQADRYSTARALADDIEHWLADEPIVAAPDTTSERISRWGRKHKGWVQASAVALIFVSASAVATSWIVGNARQAQAESKQRESEALARAAHTSMFESGLQSARWDQEHFNRMEQILSAWSKLSAKDAASARNRMYERIGQFIREKIRSPRLTESDLPPLRQLLALLDGRDAALTAALEKDLEIRLRSWEPIFDLRGDFQGWEQILSTNDIAKNKNILERRVVNPAIESGTKDAELMIMTSVDCGCDVQLEATFDARWRDSSEFGLELNRNAKYGYRFVVRNDTAKSPNGKTAGTMCILRNGIVLRERPLTATEWKSRNLRLLAWREGSRLRFQLNAGDLLEIMDPFPLFKSPSEKFAMRWPQGVGIETLTARRLSKPQEASPLEQADELYSSEEYQSALNIYQNQGLLAGSYNLGQEARYKQGVCLIGLGRSDEAAQLFEQVIRETGDHWPLLANIQLWALLLEQKKLEQADEIFIRLSHQYSFEQLAKLTPDSVRQSIARAYLIPPASTHSNPWQNDPNRTRNLERSVQLFRLLDAQTEYEQAFYDLLVSLEYDGDYDRAVRLTLNRIEEQPTNPDRCREYLKALRLSGAPALALARMSNGWPVELRENPVLRLERAYCLVALNQLGAAEEAVASLSEATEKATREKADFTEVNVYWSSCFLHGFLLERRGEKEQAQASWKAAAVHLNEWPRSWINSSRRYIMIRLLGGELNAEDVDWYLKSGAPGSMLSMSRSVLSQDQLKQIFTAAWKTSRFHQLAWREATDSVTAKDRLSSLSCLYLYQALVNGAFEGKVSEEQDEEIWTTSVLFHRFVTETPNIDPRILLAVGMTWKGTTNVFGWDGIASSLDNELRYRAAYLVAHRMLKLNKRDEALRFLKVAARDAPEGSTLKKLATQEAMSLDQ